MNHLKNINGTSKRNTGAIFNKPNYGHENIYFQMGKRLNEIIIQQQQQQLQEQQEQQKISLKNNESTSTKIENVNKLNQNSDSLYEQNSDLKSSRFENLPIGKLANANKWSAESKELSSPSIRESVKRVNLKNRTTLKEELIISEQFMQKVPDYKTRKNLDLMRIVEDQVSISILNIFLNY